MASSIGVIPRDDLFIQKSNDEETNPTVKDFNSFVDRTFGGFDLGRGTSYTDQIWKAQMLGLKGDKWREVRATFSPIFTSGKMKMMMQGAYSIA